MKRILLVLTVALMMAAMMVASAMPAFAVTDNTPNCNKGQGNAAFDGNKELDNAFKHCRFFLFSHRRCSSLFMQVGVSVGVNGVSFDVDLYLYPPPLHSVLSTTHIGE